MKALLFILISTTFLPAAFAACGSFELVLGEIAVSSPGKPDSVASEGSNVCAGDTVKAGDESRATIRMEDGNEINISPNSDLVIQTYESDPALNKKKVFLNVLKGRVRATTAAEDMYGGKSTDGQSNDFIISTKTAVAGVRGTDFLVGYSAETQETEVVTFRGKVDFGLPGPGGSIRNAVQVPAGQRTRVASANRLPEKPRSLSAQELKKFDAESRSKKTGKEKRGPKSPGTQRQHRAERRARRAFERHQFKHR